MDLYFEHYCVNEIEGGGMGGWSMEEVEELLNLKETVDVTKSTSKQSWRNVILKLQKSF